MQFFLLFQFLFAAAIVVASNVPLVKSLALVVAANVLYQGTGGTCLIPGTVPKLDGAGRK